MRGNERKASCHRDGSRANLQIPLNHEEKGVVMRTVPVLTLYCPCAFPNSTLILVWHEGPDIPV